MLDLIVQQTGVVFLMISIGYLCGKFKIINYELQNGLSNIILIVVLPSHLVASSNMQYSSDSLSRILTFSIICFLYFSLSMLIFYQIAKYLPLREEQKKQFITLTTFPSSAFMGIPIISALYNETGVFFMGVFSLFYSSFQYTIGIGLYTGIKKDNLKKLI